MVIYDKNTGLIERVIYPDDAISSYIEHYKNNECIEIIPENYDVDPKTHYVVNGTIIEMEDYQIEELQLYRRFLTDTERLLEIMKPSNEEVKEAEMTIKILTLIQEVI